MNTLLEIGDDLLALATLIDEHGEELSSEVEQALEAWFAEVGEARDRKLDGYAALIRSMELRAAVRKEESDRLLKRVQVDANTARRLKDRLKMFMEMTGLKKVETARYRIVVQANGGKVPVDVQAAVEELAPVFVRTRKEPDTDTIRAALEAGTDVPGCRLLPRGSHLRIS